MTKAKVEEKEVKASHKADLKADQEKSDSQQARDVADATRANEQRPYPAGHIGGQAGTEVDNRPDAYNPADVKFDNAMMRVESFEDQIRHQFNLTEAEVGEIGHDKRKLAERLQAFSPGSISIETAEKRVEDFFKNAKDAPSDWLR